MVDIKDNDQFYCGILSLNLIIKLLFIYQLLNLVNLNNMVKLNLWNYFGLSWGYIRFMEKFRLVFFKVYRQEQVLVVDSFDS